MPHNLVARAATTKVFIFCLEAEAVAQIACHAVASDVLSGDVLCLLTAVPVSTPSGRATTRKANLSDRPSVLLGCQHKKPESDRAWEFLFLFELTEKLLDPEKPPLREAGQPVSATPDCPVKARMSGRSALEWKFCGPTSSLFRGLSRLARVSGPHHSAGTGFSACASTGR